MDIKTRLKERLLEIPINYRAFREKYRLARELEVESEEVEILLNELCEKDILSEKIQYICPSCSSTSNLTKELLDEMLVDDNHFECDECTDLINIKRNKTGYVYYDIKNREALANW